MKLRTLTATFEIVVLVLATFAFAWSMHSFTSSLSSFETEEESYSQLFVLFLTQLVEFLEVIPTVSAQTASEPAFVCCPQLSNGAVCQDVLASEATGVCAVTPSSTACEFDARCKLGCAIDPNEGLCTANAPRGDLPLSQWVEGDTQCLNDQCVRGCCVLGDEAQFVTEGRCDVLAATYGFDQTKTGELFHPEIRDELSCLLEVASEAKGACVDGASGACTFTSEIACLNSGGDFSKDLLCTAESLGTVCEPTEQTTCVEGRDEVFFVDSCGNVANIYDENAPSDYWERIVPKPQSCSLDYTQDDLGADQCGNCNTFLGSRCSESGGQAQCVSLACEASEATGGVARENGESWCVYDGTIDLGRDTPGSRHWKRSCIDGEVKLEPCADYRGEICVQNEIDDPTRDVSFSLAQCKVNEAFACLQYNNEIEETDEGLNTEPMVEACTANEDCYVKNINVDSDGFVFDMCLPRYPRGFNLREESASLSGELCTLASQTCVVIEQKEIDGDWECIHNCDCQDEEFTRQMNEMCISLGDCGGSVNYVGEFSDDYSVARAPRLSQRSISQLSEYNEVVEGQAASPKPLSAVAAGFSRTPEGAELALDEGSELEALKTLGKISGGIGMSVKVLGFLAKGEPIFGGAQGQQFFTAEQSLGTYLYSSPGEPLTPSLANLKPATTVQSGGFLSALSGFSIGITIGGFVAEGFGLSGHGAIAVVAGAALAGGIVGLAGANFFAGSTALGGLLSGNIGLFISSMGWSLIAAVVIAVVVSALGIGDTREIHVEFSCMPWQAPIGGDDCEACNDETGLYPCTEYRCESLGQSCEYLNSGTQFAACEATQRQDASPPAITPGETTEGYDYTDEQGGTRVSVRTELGDCIPEFSEVAFSLQTDERSQCRYGFERRQEFDAMTRYPREMTAYTYNHTFSFMMPSVDSLSVYDLDASDAYGQMLGAQEVYVLCQDTQGNVNTQPYVIDFCVEEGPDLTPPRILSSDPASGTSLRYGTTSTQLTLYTNEPATCRYQYGSDASDYDVLTQEMICSWDLQSITRNGYVCRAQLEGLEIGNNDIFVTCRDQPWIDDPDYQVKPGAVRNTNNGDVLRFISTEDPLEVSILSPTGTIVSGFTPQIAVDLEVATYGGAQDGKALCSYSLGGYGQSLIEMYSTLSDYHEQPGLTFLAGNYEIFVECMDTAGNVARNSSAFTLEIDETVPTIARAYHEGGSLEIITTEDAKCYYDYNRCNFDIRNASTQSMSVGFGREHTAVWTEGQTYHIKCEDIYGNYAHECGIVIHAE